MNVDTAKTLLRGWIREAVDAYKKAGIEYTDSEILDAVLRRSENLGNWHDVKTALEAQFFYRQIMSMIKRIARIAFSDDKNQLDFSGEGFDPFHSYVIGFTEDGEGRKRAAHAMTGDEAEEADQILRRSINYDQAKRQLLDKERARLPSWRGTATWAEANKNAEALQETAGASRSQPTAIHAPPA